MSSLRKITTLLMILQYSFQENRINVKESLCFLAYKDY